MVAGPIPIHKFGKDKIQGHCRFCLRSDNGQGLSEYLIIVVVVAILVIVAIRMFGGSVSNQIEVAKEEVTGLQEGGSGGLGPPESSVKGVTSKPESLDQSDENSWSDGSTGTGIGGSKDGSGSLDDLKPDPEGGIREIKLGWGTLAFLGALAFGAGLYVLFSTKDEKKSKKKKKQKKS